MAKTSNYRWPTKLKKFGIDDQFLRFLVAKYENEIHWQIEVRNQDTMYSFVQDRMLPGLLSKVEYPPCQGTKHHYVSAKSINLNNALTTDQELDTEDKEIIKLIRDEDGETEASNALLQLVNTRKAKAFQEWIDLLQRKYPDHPAFQLLIMRSLFDLSDAGTRRTVVPPSSDVIDWMYRRIINGRLTPNENIARIYCWKLGAGTQRVPVNGWQYIPSGTGNAPQLAAASRGSGWCVASQGMGAHYLEYSCFYILRFEGSPMVALRADSSGKNIGECQGRNNCSPDGWFHDIDLFLRTQNLSLTHREYEMNMALNSEGELTENNLYWWQERVKYWPFCLGLAPPEIIKNIGNGKPSDIAAYIGFPAYQTLAAQMGLDLDLQDWKMIVEIDPYRYVDCPAKYQESSELTDACIQGWVECVEDNEITLSEIRRLPEFVKTNDSFQKTLQSNFSRSLQERIRRSPRNAVERLNRFNLEDYLPAVSGELTELAVERALNILLNNQDENFSDNLFPEKLRAREDFLVVRERAWLEAIQVHPPLWFALPDDLVELDRFTPRQGDKFRVDLNAWVIKVTESPWLLTQKSSVPKSIRHHRRILEAYKHGWIFYLRVKPWRIWVKRGLYRRVYMSYALLADEEVALALQEGWRAHARRIEWAWNQASCRMQNMLVMQVSLLRAICHGPGIRVNSDVLNVCLDVKHRFDRQAKLFPHNPHIEEIGARLSRAGIYLQKDRRGAGSV